MGNTCWRRIILNYKPNDFAETQNRITPVAAVILFTRTLRDYVYLFTARTFQFFTRTKTVFRSRIVFTADSAALPTANRKKTRHLIFHLHLPNRYILNSNSAQYSSQLLQLQSILNIKWAGSPVI